MGNKPSQATPSIGQERSSDSTPDQNGLINTKKTQLPSKKSSRSFRNPLKRSKTPSEPSIAKSDDSGMDVDSENNSLRVRNYISFITKRPSNIFLDKDQLEGQEFYTEIRTKKQQTLD